MQQEEEGQKYRAHKTTTLISEAAAVKKQSADNSDRERAKSKVNKYKPVSYRRQANKGHLYTKRQSGRDMEQG